MTDATALSDRPPRVFISYSWDSVAHKAWVLAFAYALVERGGVDVVLDHWHLHDGDDKTYFMEQSVTESDYVLVVCTPTYAQKANDRAGGVGYEAMILTSELAQSVLTRKFIPVLREGEWNNATPRWLSTRFGRDLRGDPCSPEEFEQLLRTLHGAHLRPPKPGPRPNFAPPATPRLIFTPASGPVPAPEAPPSTASAVPAAAPAPSAVPSSPHPAKSPSEEESKGLREVKTSSLRPAAPGAIALVVVALFAVGIGLWATHVYRSRRASAPANVAQSAAPSQPGVSQAQEPSSTPSSQPTSVASPPGKKAPVAPVTSSPNNSRSWGGAWGPSQAAPAPKPTSKTKPSSPASAKPAYRSQNKPAPAHATQSAPSSAPVTGPTRKPKAPSSTPSSQPTSAASSPGKKAPVASVTPSWGGAWGPSQAAPAPKPTSKTKPSSPASAKPAYRSQNKPAPAHATQSAPSSAPVTSQSQKPKAPSLTPSSQPTSAASQSGNKSSVADEVAYAQATKKAAEDAAQAPDPQSASAPAPAKSDAPAGAPPAAASNDLFLAIIGIKEGDQALQLYSEKKYAEALPIAKKACDLGNALGCVVTGQIYQFGPGEVPPSVNEAIPYYRKACDKNSSDGCFRLAQIYAAQGFHSQAVALWKRACELHNPDSCSRVGVQYENDKDYANALIYLGRACDANLQSSCYESGKIYEKSPGILDNKKHAQQSYTKACNLGDAEACKRLKHLKP